MTGLRGCCSSSTQGSRANDAVKTRAKRVFWRKHSPCSRGCWTNNTWADRSLFSLFPLKHETHKFAIFSQKFVPHSSHWTAVAAILFLVIQWALSPAMYLNKSNRTDCTKWGAFINLPAGFHACASKCSVRVLICVWSQMSCCKWLKLSLEFNFAVGHTSRHTEPATRSYDVTMI